MGEGRFKQVDKEKTKYSFFTFYILINKKTASLEAVLNLCFGFWF